MMSSFEVFEDYAYKVGPMESISPGDGSLPSDVFYIKIQLRNLIFYYLPPDEDGERPLFTSQGPIQKQSFVAGRSAVLGKRSWTNISLMLTHELNVPSYVHPFIVQKIYSTAFSMACEASRTGRTVMPIRVCIVKSYFRTVNEDDGELIARVSSLSMEDRVYMPVPASKSSIEALEKVSLLEEESDSRGLCMICLEELSVMPAEVTRMPCSHIYHGGCIVRWLEKSHLCPLCRFQMPTDTEVD